MENKTKSDIGYYSDNKGSVLYQVSLLQSLAYGDYNGIITMKELKHHGNTAIGTFDRLNGELIMLDGVIYRAAGDGSVELVSEEETTPFCVAAFMNTEASERLKEITDYSTLDNELNKLVEEKGKNHFYMIRIDGLFREINVRSVPPQTEPYKSLVEVLAKQQTVFNYENTEGTIVGLYCPPYMSQLNAAGWHMHFVSRDKTKGGHVLGLNIADAVLVCNAFESFQLFLPQNGSFDNFDFTVDQSEDIEKIERI